MNGHLDAHDVEPQPAARFPNGTGIYQSVPAEEYHGLEGRASSTVLRKILNKSPAHGKAKMEDDSDPTPAMKFGTRMHTALLEPYRFEKDYAVADKCSATTGSGSRCKSSGQVAWRTAHGDVLWTCNRSSHQPDLGSVDVLDEPCPYCGAEAGERCETSGGNPAEAHADRRDAAKPVIETEDGDVPIEGRADVEKISEEQDEKILAMRKAIKKRPKANLLLNRLPGISELTILWEHDSGVLCKSRIDRVVEHDVLGTVAVDYKTTRNAQPGRHEFGRSALRHSYDVQAAFYLEALASVGLPTDNFCFVAQEKTPPYDVVSYVVPAEPEAAGPSLMEVARQDMESALETYKECSTKGEWPGYTGAEDRIQTLKVPHWRYE